MVLFHVRQISILKKLKWHEMTREERAHLMLYDYQSYAEKVPEGHWLQILDGIARSGPAKSLNQESNPAS